MTQPRASDLLILYIVTYLRPPPPDTDLTALEIMPSAVDWWARWKGVVVKVRGNAVPGPLKIAGERFQAPHSR